MLKCFAIKVGFIFRITLHQAKNRVINYIVLFEVPGNCDFEAE